MFNRSGGPYDDMLSLRDAVGQLFEGSFVRPSATLGTGVAGSFPLNVAASEDELKVEALLPGVSEEDLNITVDQGILRISAKRHGPETNQRQQWYLREIVGGEFTRSLTLPFTVEVDQVSASFQNGVLTLRLPKAAAARPKKIQVGSSQQAQITEASAR